MAGAETTFREGWEEETLLNENKEAHFQIRLCRNTFISPLGVVG